MGYLDWIGRDRASNKTTEPRVTWISDVYAIRRPLAAGQLDTTWAWASVHETASGKFNAGMTVRDGRLNFTKWKTGEGYVKESEAVSFAQNWFKEWRSEKPEMKVAGSDAQSIVKNWYKQAEIENRGRDRKHSRGIDF